MKRWLISMCAAFLSVAALALDAPPLANVRVNTVDGKKSLTLEVAANPEARKFGLMNREHIGQFQGMLFLFPKANDYEFWMSNTHIPLDMLFVDATGKIVHIEHEVEPESLRPRSAKQLITSVIELSGGTARAENIQAGDYIEVSFTQPVDIR